MSTSAAPASFIPDALPAVTVPSGLKTGRRAAIDSGEASSRMCSSRTKSTVSRLTLTGMGTIWSSKRPAARAAAALRCERTANSSWRSREMEPRSARFSAVTPIRIELKGSVSAPITGSTSSASPMRAPQRALGIQYGPRLIDSAPPASATAASPVWIACAAETIAWTPVPQRRLTV